MKTKLIISPFTKACEGCLFVENGMCIRPEDHESCLVESAYGIHDGIYVSAEEEESGEEESEDKQ